MAKRMGGVDSIESNEIIASDAQVIEPSEPHSEK
jgi:hypothetical protein